MDNIAVRIIIQERLAARHPPDTGLKAIHHEQLGFTSLWNFCPPCHRLAPKGPKPQWGCPHCGRRVRKTPFAVCAVCDGPLCCPYCRDCNNNADWITDEEEASEGGSVENVFSYYRADRLLLFPCGRPLRPSPGYVHLEQVGFISSMA